MARKTVVAKKMARTVLYLDPATKTAIARLTVRYGSSSASETVRRAIGDFDRCFEDLRKRGLVIDIADL